MHAAILDAARRLVIRDGYDQVSIESIAKEAGVSRPTVYRRWPSKAHVVFEVAFGSVPVRDVLAGTGDFESDLRRFAGSVVAFWSDPVVEAATLGILAERHRDPDLRIRAQQLLDESTRARFRTLVQAGIDEGVARPDLDIDTLYDLLIGTTFYGTQVLGRGHSDADDFVDRLCSLVMRGSAATEKERP